MPLVSMAEILKDANQHGYAVGAFNVNNLEMAQAISGLPKTNGRP